MPGYDYPDPSEDLMDKIKKRLEEHQKRKQHRGRQLAVVVAVILLFAIPASAYNIAREYWGFASGVRIAIENEEGIKIGKKLRHGDWDLTIENAVWEENNLGVTYSLDGISYRLGTLQIVDENDNQIHSGYALSGGIDGGTIDFKSIDLGSIEGDQVWLRIPALLKNEFPPSVASSASLEVTPAMKKRQYEEINKKLKVEQGTYLFKDIYFSRDNLYIDYEFTPRAKYRGFYSSGESWRLHPTMEIKSEGQSYGYGVVSMSPGNSTFRGTIRFYDVPIEKLESFQIDILDNIVLVDWKLPIPIQKKETVSYELAEEMELPEGKLTLTGMRHGTKSTAIDFSFEPAEGYEGISSIWFEAYLRNNGKYYHRHGFAFEDNMAVLSGTVTFDPVRYDNVEELEFILGKIKYTYSTDTGVSVSLATIPQTIEAMGSSFTIDKMEHKDGQTLLHITFGEENRWFYDADFSIRVPGASSLRVRQDSEMGLAQLKDREELKKGLQRLKDNVGDYDWELKDVDLEQNVIGKKLEISGEREEVEVYLNSLSTIRFSGKTVKMPLK